MAYMSYVKGHLNERGLRTYCDGVLLSKDIECAEDGGSEHFVSDIIVDQNEGVLYLNLC